MSDVNRTPADRGPASGDAPAADPAFAAFVEWQLRTELRRAAAFGPARRARRWNGLRIAVVAILMTASMLLGAAGAYAASRAQDDAHRALLVARAEIGLEQAQARRDDRAAALEEAEALFESGAASETEVAHLRAQLARLEGDVERGRLDLREIGLTGRAPRDDLGAPLVGGEDFVSARLETLLTAVASELQRHARLHELTANLVEAGAASAREVEETRAEVERTAGELESVKRRLALRAAVLAGELSAVRAELEQFVAAAEAEQGAAEREMRLARGAEAQAATLAESGVASRSELRAAQTRLRSAEARRRLAEIELRVARARVATQDDHPD